MPADLLTVEEIDRMMPRGDDVLCVQSVTGQQLYSLCRMARAMAVLQERGRELRRDAGAWQCRLRSENWIEIMWRPDPVSAIEASDRKRGDE